MKKFVKGRWFSLSIVIIVVTALLVFLYCKGFRITYAPNLENSWDAISAFATWAGVIMSFAAMMTAIWTPIRIANRQDKIALFEKRMECFDTIQSLLVIAKQMENVQVNKGVQTAFRVYLGQPEDFVNNISAAGFALQLKQKQTIVMSGAFLFPHYDDELLQKIIDAGVILIMETATSSSELANTPLSSRAIQLKTEYCYLCKKYESTYLQSMEKELQLSNDT